MTLTLERMRSADFRAVHARIAEQHWQNGFTMGVTDTQRAEAHVFELYRALGLPKPRLTWVDSWPGMVSHWLTGEDSRVDYDLLADWNWYDHPNIDPLEGCVLPANSRDRSLISQRVEPIAHEIREFCGDVRFLESPLSDVIDGEFDTLPYCANVVAVERTMLWRLASGYVSSDRNPVWNEPFWQHAQAARGPLVFSHCISPLDPDALCAFLAADTAIGPRANRVAQCWHEIATSCHGAALTDGRAILCRRPKAWLELDANNAIHGVEGPSIVYGDGWRLWGRHGNAIPRQAIEAPSELPVKKVEQESNLAIRYALLLAIGPKRLAQEPGATVIQEDECGQLLRRNWYACPTIFKAAQPLKYGGWYGRSGGGCHCPECQIDMDGAIWQGQFEFVPGCDTAREAYMAQLLQG